MPTVSYQPLARLTRPAPAIFQAQMTLVFNYADLRPDRTSEIMMQLGGAAGFLSSIAFAHPDRARWTLELLGVVFRLAGFVEHRLKHALACRRPLEYSPQIQPMILTPAHSEMPSGHATETFAMALVLRRLISGGAPVYTQSIYDEQLMRLAARVAINRIVAGVHTPASTIAGAVLGLTLGEYFVQRCLPAATTYNAWEFDGAAFPGNQDFVWTDLFDAAASAQTTTGYGVNLLPGGGKPLGAASAILQNLWTRASAEWP